VERIEHGVQALRDPALVARLVHDQIPLTVCPLSNLKLKVFPTLARHKLGRMLDAGLVATVNSDDPAYFGGYLNENFTQTFAALGLNTQHAYQLAHNSFAASFIDASSMRVFQDRLAEVFETFA
jgi:adenosine deaminase